MAKTGLQYMGNDIVTYKTYGMDKEVLIIQETDLDTIKIPTNLFLNNKRIYLTNVTYQINQIFHYGYIFFCEDNPMGEENIVGRGPLDTGLRINGKIIYTAWRSWDTWDGKPGVTNWGYVFFVN